jgi:Superfamily II DNA helicase
MQNWNEEEIEREARSRLGLTALRPFQTLIVLSIMESAASPSPSPILAILPTGGGKSVCFTLPALLLDGISVIVYPIRALMNDQYESMKRKGIGASLLIGGMTREERKAEIRKLRSGKAKILITNIEMLSSFSLIEELRTFHISLFVVDEAHTVISWGETFRKKYLDIGKTAALLSPSLVVAFTATADERIKKGLESVLFCKMKYHTIYGGSNRVNLVFHAKKAISVSSEIFSELKKGQKLPAVVFTRRRAEAENLALQFAPHFDTRYYHAGLENEQKKKPKSGS